jgi:membrane protease YdiL (CAAX protease family)
LTLGTGIFLVQILTYSLAAAVLMRALNGRVFEWSSSNLGSMLAGLPLSFWLARSILTSLGEELTMRAFLQTRLTQLSWPNWAAVLTSAVLQSAYHFYQGVQATALMLPMFVIAAAIYQQQRRLWPLWLAHCLIDVSPLVASAFWAHPR